MFKIGNHIKYGFYSNVEIVDKDEKHYILKDSKGNTKKVYIELVEANASLIDSPTTVFLMEYEQLCEKHKIFINIHVQDPRMEPLSICKDEGYEETWDSAFKRSLIRIEKNTFPEENT